MAGLQATIAIMTTQHTFSPSLPGAPLTPGPPGKPFKKGEKQSQSDLLNIRKKACK